jgi:predicted nucleic acid binding AN1-type Zn finger protein
VKTPDLQGKWQGKLKSSYDKFKTEYNIELNISQTWTRISIDLKASESFSESQTASLVLRGNRSPEVIYTYNNDPKGDAVGTMNKHSGTTVLKLEDDSHLTGEYYTGRGRKNHGTMELQKC